MDSQIGYRVFSNSTLEETLDDLCVRFIVHLPDGELKSVERICFQIEEAHWFYEDFIRDINPTFPNVNLKSFIFWIFQRIPKSLINHLPESHTESAFADFMAYKIRVPVRGVIMLNLSMDQCVLVKGWKSSSSWSFPRGKIDQDEDDMDCAVREALEETGYDLKGKLGATDFIDMSIREQNLRLYIVPGVPMDTMFAPRTRKEISKIEWHRLSELPGYVSKRALKGFPSQRKHQSGRFYMVAPFVKEVRRWISTSGKIWLQEQHKTAQSQKISAMSAEEDTEPEGENFPQSPGRPGIDGVKELKTLLGIESTTEVVQDGHTTGEEQELVSKRLRETLSLEPTNEADVTSPTNGPNSPEGSCTRVNGQAKCIQPNAQVLLSLLQGAPQQPENIQPSQQSPLTPQRQQSRNMQNRPYQGPQTPMQDSQHHRQQELGQSPYMRENIRMEKSPLVQPIQNGVGLLMRPGNYSLPSSPPTSRFGVHPPQPFVGRNVGSLTHQNNYPQLFQRQVPRTVAETYLPPPLPSKPPDPSQAGALLSILKSDKPSTALSPPRGPRSQMPQYRQPVSFHPQTPRPNLHPAPPPSQLTSSTHLPPSPHVPFKTSTPTIIDHYGTQKKSIPMPPTNFDRRESVSDQQAQTLLAMFRTSDSTLPISNEAITSSPETPARVAPANPAISRLTTPTPKAHSKVRSPCSKDKESLLSYLQGVADTARR